MAKSKAKPKIDEKGLKKGQLRKLEALRNSLGPEIADEAFLKWMAGQADGTAADPTAERIAAALEPILDFAFDLAMMGFPSVVASIPRRQAIPAPTRFARAFNHFDDFCPSGLAAAEQVLDPSRHESRAPWVRFATSIRGAGR